MSLGLKVRTASNFPSSSLLCMAERVACLFVSRGERSCCTFCTVIYTSLLCLSRLCLVIETQRRIIRRVDASGSYSSCSGGWRFNQPITYFHKVYGRSLNIASNLALDMITRPRFPYVASGSVRYEHFASQGRLKHALVGEEVRGGPITLSPQI